MKVLFFFFFFSFLVDSFDSTNLEENLSFVSFPFIFQWTMDGSSIEESSNDFKDSER